MSLMDPSKWLAAWNFTGGNAAPYLSNGAGAFDMRNTNLFVFNGITGATWPNSAYIATAPMNIAAGKTALSMHFFYSESNVTFANGFGLEATVLGVYNNGQVSAINLGLYATIYPDPRNAATPVAIGLTFGGGRFKTYANGTLLDDSAFAGPLNAVNDIRTASTFRSQLNIANPVIYDGELSPAAIAALAAGRMPDSSGNLI